MTDTNEKMTLKTITHNLEMIASASAFFTTLRRKALSDNTTLSLGDQLRCTTDYNGTLFEVVREPYWCWLDDKGRACEFITQDAEDEYTTLKEAEEALEVVKSIWGDDEENYEKSEFQGWITDVSIVKRKVEYEPRQQNRPEGYEMDDDVSVSSDEEQEPEYRYVVKYKCHFRPPGTKFERRIWVRKICLISKAEGYTDDKNHRSLPFPIRTIKFGDLIWSERMKLDKISRCIEATNPGERKTKKKSLYQENKKRLEELMKIWCNRVLNDTPVKGFFSEKYGLFLKSDSKYNVVIEGKNALKEMIDDVSEIREDVKDTIVKKRDMIAELKSTTE